MILNVKYSTKLILKINKMEKILDIKGIDLATLFGAADAHLRLIEGSFAVNVVV